MSTQIAVRLPEALMKFVDEEVEAGAGSRAEVVRRALERARRRKEAERDAEIYARTEPDPDTDTIMAWRKRVGYPPLDID